MRPFRFLSDNLDELVFEHRNKEYGAYELRKSYDSRLIKSFLSALILIAVAIAGPVLIHHLFFSKPIVVPPVYSAPMNVKNNIEIEQKKNTGILPQKPSRQNKMADAPFRVLRDSLFAKEEIKKDMLVKSPDVKTLPTNSSADTTQGEGKQDLETTAGNRSTGEPETVSSTVFNLAGVDKNPQFPGGERAMMRFLQKNIHYNEIARRENITGRVYVSFIINSKGEMEATKIIHHLGYGLDEEVIRVLGTMPPWEPGYYKGKPVSTILNIPVLFSIVQ